MRKAELDHLLEAAVAKALHVSLPVDRRRQKLIKKSPARHPVRHAA